jgi:hypothetical protein
MLCLGLAGKFKSLTKWASTGFYNCKKQIHIISLLAGSFINGTARFIKLNNCWNIHIPLA